MCQESKSSMIENMKRFEYRICAPDRPYHGGCVVDIDVLNKYGEKGWEAIAVLNDERVLMKREIE